MLEKLLSLAKTLRGADAARPVFEAFKRAAAAKFVAPALARAGWDPRPDDAHLARKLRGEVIAALPTFCDDTPEVVAEASRRVAAFAAGDLGVNSMVCDGDLVADWTPIRDTLLRRRLESNPAEAPAPSLRKAHRELTLGAPTTLLEKPVWEWDEVPTFQQMIAPGWNKMPVLFIPDVDQHVFKKIIYAPSFSFMLLIFPRSSSALLFSNSTASWSVITSHTPDIINHKQKN